MKEKQITYGLPEDVEKLLLSGVSAAKCKKRLKEYPDYADKSVQELQEILSDASTYLFAEKSARTFEKDFEYYRISPVMDDKSCPLCKKMASEKFRFSERKAGVNFPPLHKGCRCSWEVVVDDWDNWINSYVKQKSKHSSMLKKFFKR